MSVKLWEKYEIDFIKENYSENGAKYCSEHLNRTRKACVSKATDLKLNYLNYKYRFEHLSIIVKESKTKSECVIKLGLSARCSGNFQTLDKYIKLYNLDISHFEYSHNKIFDKKPLCEVMIENSTFHTRALKTRLYKEGIKERKCELCGQGEEWNGMKISLILDHKNGVSDDHRLENLRIVCPNCNAGLETHCRGHNRMSKQKDNSFRKEKVIKEKNINNKHSKIYYCSCGKIKSKESKMCLDCHNKIISFKQRKVIRPPYEQLINEIKSSSYVATGKKYNVSDNAIRKWVKYYEKNINFV
jgi:hypothetical protein